jgi:glycosyltransferase involved in cell wall biosynthesis
VRVLLITPEIPEELGSSGGAIAAYAFVAALADRHQVAVAALSLGNPRADEALGRLQADSVEAHAIVAAWPGRRRVAPQWLLGRAPMRVVQYRNARMQELINRLAESRRFDVIHVLDTVMGAYDYPSGVSRLLVEQDADIPSPLPSWLGARDRRRRTAEQRRVWHGFDLVQVYSDHDAAAVRATAPELAPRVRVSPLAVALPELDVHQEELPLTMVFVGQFMHPPNVDAALWLANSILPLVRDAVPEVQLQIVGAFPPPAVRDLAGDGVVVTGRVPDVRPYVEQATLVVAPVRSGGGVRLKLLQAMALGKAVVTTPLGAAGVVPDEFGDPALVVASDAPDFAAATVALLLDDSHRAELGRRARTRVATDHSYASFAGRLDRLYAELPPVPSEGET